MLVTVSTVKETVEGLDRFVRRNLAGGVDHLVVFVEDPDPAVMSALQGRPEVTAVATDADWWGPRRPGQLNARQKINANLARAAVVAVAGIDWIWHLDGDEVLRVDHAALARVPEDRTVLHAPPLEAVSRPAWPEGRVTWFKRLLDEDELTLLKVLGVVDRPVNEDLFHGHTRGKSAMRPGLDRWFALHEVVDAADAEVPPYDGEQVARLLHYESWSGEEFVRKWDNILGSGQLPAMRGNRQTTAVALRALGAAGLPEPTRRDYLARIYARTTEDDLDTLRDLGMLVELDPDDPGHRPVGSAPDGSADVGRTLSVLLGAFAGVDKRAFRAPDTAEAQHQALGDALGRLAGSSLPREVLADAEEAWGAVSSSGGTRARRWLRGGT